ncbi:MAG: hypothetical protein KBB94_05425 [Legionellaceae bacterium]|nr:hypothetical protein [Legionellaceae bacterium]MBP9775162.1 hypothetical protein [Legionellaceae bacterium]
MPGKWSCEQVDITIIQDQLTKFKHNIASLKGQSPRDFLELLARRLHRIQQKLQGKHKFSFFDSRIPSLLARLQKSQEEIEVLMLSVTKAEKTAETIRRKCETITEEMTHWRPISPSGVDGSSPISRLGKSYQCSSPFDTIRTAGGNVWASIRSKLEGMASQDFDKINHNALAFLLLSDDASFVEAINFGTLPIEGEIGHLIIQRLKELYFTKSLIKSTSTEEEDVVNHRIRNLSAKLISRSMSGVEDGLLKCDFDTLYLELTKLALHAELYPEAKVFWLGTSRAVMAVIRKRAGQGTYLNCDDSKWSWHLNRIWLQAAMILGYQCELVEQHFPNIEEAFFSQDGGAFVEELLKAVRPKNTDCTSQYNGYDAPTATSQEILVLMDMGCVANKHEENNRIYFSKPQTKEMPSPSSNGRTSPSKNILYHSWDGGFSASASPHGRSKDQFFASRQSSIEIRSQIDFLSARTPSPTGLTS